MNQPRLIRLIIRANLTLFIALVYCYAWCWLEKLIDGNVVNRAVDNIMMLLFMPIIFIATDVLIK